MLGSAGARDPELPTLADALECTSRYLFVHARSLSLSLVPDPYGARGVVALRYGMEAGDLAQVQGTDLGLGFLHRALQSLVAESVRVAQRGAALPAGRRRCRSTRSSSAPRCGSARPAALLRVPSALADRSLAGGDPGLRRLALAFLDQQAAESGPNLVPKVRGAVQQSLGTAPPTSRRSPGCSAMHPRTLQRRLAEEGASFAGHPRRRAAPARPPLPDDDRHAAQPGRRAAGPLGAVRAEPVLPSLVAEHPDRRTPGRGPSPTCLARLMS